MSGWTTRGVVLSTVLVVATGLSAATNIGIQGYGAVRDDVSGETVVFGQQIVHRAFDVTVEETTRRLPILSLQYAGAHYRQGPSGDPNHVEGRAICVAERLMHAWNLMDHGASLEVLPDEWNVPRVHAQDQPETRLAVCVRNTAAGLDPLRIVTVYPEDVTGYPWITSERSLAEYWIALMQAHHLLFWKYEADIGRYDDLRISRTREGRVFREIARRAVARARSRGQPRFDGEILREVLRDLSPSQRQTLYRLAMMPPMDWEPSVP